MKVLVVGSIHGNEPAGRAVLARLRQRDAAGGRQLWLVRRVNPDGARRGTRQNARGVDLNRNFPRRWRRRRAAFDTYFPGRRACSEPESRAVRRLVTADPARRVTVWYHQALRLVNLSSGADPRVVRAYARRVGLPARPLPNYRGTATSWQNHALPGTSAFVVELPAGPLAAAGARRHARRGARRARRRRPPPPRARPPASSGAGSPSAPRRRAPDARLRPAPLRHLDRHAADPKVIVEHFTATTFALGLQHVRRQRARRRS